MSADGRRWFLLNASPDVREQLARLSSAAPLGARQVPFEGIVLTDAELDHTLGVALLREAGRLNVWATSGVLETLAHDSGILPVTEAFATVNTIELPLGVRARLCDRDGVWSGLAVEAFAVAGGAPRFASVERPGHTVGLAITDEESGASCGFVPGCGALDGALLARLGGTKLVLFDGTFWSDDELIALGIGSRTAREMDHIPISGPDGSLATLASLRGPRCVYTHINNTNPILLEDSAERARVERAGITVGADGMTFVV